MLREKVYPKVEPTINQWVERLHSLGVTPNQLSLGGVFLSLLAGMIFAKGFFVVGALVLMGAGLGDMLDGALARKSGKASKFGAFLDSTLDRFSDFFIFCGIALYFASNLEPIWELICFGIILGGFMVSYTKARAENLIDDCGVGFFNRELRFVIILAGTLFTFLLKPALVILLIGSHATAIYRIYHTYKNLAEDNESTTEEDTEGFNTPQFHLNTEEQENKEVVESSAEEDEKEKPSFLNAE